jgi:MFS superfamily sulfate permease-like transporter
MGPSFRRWVPGVEVLRTYQRSWLKSDLTAGVVLTLLLIPAGMGYAEAAGLPPETGLYATIVPLLAYAVFGPSRILVLGPDSSLAPIIAASVLPLAAGDSSRAVALAGLLALLMGAMLLLGGILRAGFVTDLLSKPIRVGYLNGIALVVFVSQIPKLLGFSTDATSLFQEARAIVDGIKDGEVNTRSLVIGVGALAMILVPRMLGSKLPGILFAVVVRSCCRRLAGRTSCLSSAATARVARTPPRRTPLVRCAIVGGPRVRDCPHRLRRHRGAVANVCRSPR